jgi:hypothetical protein
MPGDKVEISRREAIELLKFTETNRSLIIALAAR